jgi:hypothetical protein
VSAARTPAARAARLLRWYPRVWRERYGAEFTELLICDITERPRSAGRAVDVARGGLVARLTAAGLAGCALPAPGVGVVTPQARYRQVSASLGSLGGALAVFLTVAAALWSELVIYRQDLVSAPRPAPTALLATDVISAAMLALLVLTVLAAAPVLVRRAGLSPRVLAFEVRLAAVACAVMVAVLGAAASWVATSGGSRLTGTGITAPFHAGLIDLACTVALAVVLPVAAQAARMAHRELLLARSAA